LSDYRKIKRPFKRKMTQKQEIVLDKLVNNPERFTHVIGIDEAGWGSISGPLSVSAVVLPWEFENPGFKDSKRFTTDKSRKRGSEFAKANVLAHETLFSLPQDIHKYGPAKALAYLQRKLVYTLLEQYPNALVIVDGNRIIPGIKNKRQLALVSADALVPAVSAASIIAKVARDEYMIELGNRWFPEYEFHKNKGYPTPEHLAKLYKYGPTRVHRLNVSIVQEAYDKKGWYENGESVRENQARTTCD
jgi:ribonuclease HII